MTERATDTGGMEHVGWFDALGNEIPEEQRQAAVQEARKMGVDCSDSPPWVNEVSNLVEMDRPKEAIELTRVHLDLPGTFRVLAALSVPKDGATRTTDVEQSGGEP